MHLPIGISDFRKLITEKTPTTGGYLFIDKTAFIKEILDDLTEVIVITRPRRFGKTLNLSMLQYFYAAIVDGQSTKDLFDGLEISKYTECMEYQGKYPVIYISFKDVKQPNFELCLRKIKSVIAETYRKYRKELFSDKIAKDDRLYIDSILEQKSDRIDIEDSIKRLLALLCQYYNEKPILLIDEYDTPIQEAYLQNYYNELMPFFRNFLSGPLKDEALLKRAVLTGILRISKDSLFSGLNNVSIYSLIQSNYSQHFGFTEKEVHKLLVQAELKDQEAGVKKWYNGYVFGETTVYNPWSIVNYLNNKMFRAYWVNTSDNLLIKQQLIQSSPEFKEQFKLLLEGQVLKKRIDENMVFGDLKNNAGAVWSLLLISGYLKAVSTTVEKSKTICKCAIPNLEVQLLYQDIIEEWLGNSRGSEWYHSFLNYLLSGNVDKFSENFGEVLIRTISVYDTVHNPEAFYQGFMLGLAAGIDQKQYEVKSNRESGLGRYDIAIIPKDILKPVIILEIKSIAPPKGAKKTISKTLDALLVREARKALDQINQNQYAIELVQKGFKKIVKIGLSFSGKEFRIISEGGLT